MCFYTKNSQKVNFSSNCDYNTGHFIDFSPKKVIFSSKCTCISSTIYTFLPNNPMCFYTKNSQKFNFSSNCDYNTGHFIDFSPEKSVFSSKCAHISSTILTFLPNNSLCFYNKNFQNVNFCSNCSTIIHGTLLTYLPKKVIFSQNSPAYRARF